MVRGVMLSLLTVATVWGSDADADGPHTTRFLKLDGPPVTLKYDGPVEFEISETSYATLTAAARRQPLAIRAYVDTRENLKKPRDPDVFGCVTFYYELREAIRLTRRNGKPFLATSAKVPKTWFDKPEEVTVVLVVHDGRVPEPRTRVHYSMVAAYFDSGMEIHASPRNAKDEMRPDWRMTPGSTSSSGGPNAPANPPPLHRKTYLGHVTQYSPGKFIDVEDLDTKKLYRLQLAGVDFSQHDKALGNNERARVLVLETDWPDRRVVDLYRSNEPECIFPPAAQSASTADEFVLITEVRQCDEAPAPVAPVR